MSEDEAMHTVEQYRFKDLKELRTILEMKTLQKSNIDT